MFIDKLLGIDKKMIADGHGQWGGIVGDAVLGANDGIITTFAVVAGVTGASLAPSVVLIIGFANIIADGLSMALGNYLGTKSERDFVISERKREEWEVEHKSEEEREEIRQIYKSKGFEDADLERVVQIITSDKKRWVDAMMRDELNLSPESSFKPVRSAVITFVAFLAFGFIPLLAYLPFIVVEKPFLIASLFTGIALFAVGSLSGFATKRNVLISGIEMLLIGALSAGAAYSVGRLISKII